MSLKKFQMESIPAHAFVVFLAKFGHAPRLPALSRLGRTLVPGVQAHLTRYRGSATPGTGLGQERGKGTAAWQST